MLKESKQTIYLTFVSASFFWAVQANLAGNDFILYLIQAGDPILTYYPSLSVVSLLRQPAAVGAGGFCAESNPAGRSRAGGYQPSAFWEMGFLTHHCLHSLCYKVF